jgi:hypothetical protein
VEAAATATAKINSKDQQQRSTAKINSKDQQPWTRIVRMNYGSGDNGVENPLKHPRDANERSDPLLTASRPEGVSKFLSTSLLFRSSA